VWDLEIGIWNFRRDQVKINRKTLESSLLKRYALLITALAPVIPQILGSAFNIWYNATVIEPMFTPALRQRFFDTVIIYNSVV